jgi:hypothetical protein
MSNKLKGMLIAFIIIFLLILLKELTGSQSSHWNSVPFVDLITFPLIWGGLASIIGFLIGSSTKEKK